MAGDGEFDAAILEASKEIGALLARASVDEVMARYSVGVKLAAMKKAPGTFGTRAIEALSVKLDVGTAELYACVKVALTWSRADLQKLMSRTTRSGRPLSWSHLSLCARARSAQARASLIEGCLEHAWSVGQLRRQLRASKTRRSSGEGSRHDEVMSDALREGLGFYKRALTEARMYSAAFEERLRTPNARMDEALRAELLRTLEALAATSEATLRKLRPRDSAPRLRVDARGSTAKVRVAVLTDEDDDEEKAAGRNRE